MQVSPRASDHTCPSASLPPGASLSCPLGGFPRCTRPGCAPAPFCSGHSAGHLGTSPFPLSFLQRSDFQTACSDFRIIERNENPAPTPLYLSPLCGHSGSAGLVPPEGPWLHFSEHPSPLSNVVFIIIIIFSFTILYWFCQLLKHVFVVKVPLCHQELLLLLTAFTSLSGWY